MNGKIVSNKKETTILFGVVNGDIVVVLTDEHVGPVYCDVQTQTKLLPCL